MQPSFPSANTILLVGRAVASPLPSTHQDGRRSSSFQVETTNGDRAMNHRIEIQDEFLAQAVHGTILPGSILSISGELDYDQAGAFVSVTARRGCNVQLLGSSAPVTAAQPVQAAASSAQPVQTQATAPAPRPSMQRPAAAPSRPGGGLGGLSARRPSSSDEADRPEVDPVPSGGAHRGPMGRPQMGGGASRAPAPALTPMAKTDFDDDIPF